MDWNAEWYENKHGFVAEYGRELLSCVPENPEQSILDLGCGTGTLTHALLEKSASVTGLDSSPEMIATARRFYPGMDFRVLDARLMPCATGLTSFSPMQPSIGYRTMGLS